MLITKSNKIIFEPIEFQKSYIKSAKLIISNFKDEPGILYKITGVLFVYGWNIITAKIRTYEHKIEDIFTIESIDSNLTMSISQLEKIERDLLELLENQVHITEYLAHFPEKTRKLIQNTKPDPSTKIDTEISDNGKKLKLFLVTKDKPGLLYFLSQILYLSNFNILEFIAITQDAMVRDEFLIEKSNGLEFTNKNIFELVSLIKKFI